MSDSETYDEVSTPGVPSAGVTTAENGSLESITEADHLSRRVLRPQKSVNFATFNVRTLNSAWKLDEVSQLVSTFNIQFMGIQEHRMVFDEDIKTTELQNQQHLISASATRNASAAAVGGVGLLLSDNAYRCLAKPTKISDRILLVEFNNNPKISVIS